MDLADDLQYAANLIEGRIDVEGPVFQPLLRARVARLRALRETLLATEFPADQQPDDRRVTRAATEPR